MSVAVTPRVLLFCLLFGYMLCQWRAVNDMQEALWHHAFTTDAQSLPACLSVMGSLSLSQEPQSLRHVRRDDGQRYQIIGATAMIWQVILMSKNVL